jgi:Holliday junction resolvase RusA-like endonuclease
MRSPRYRIWVEGQPRSQRKAKRLKRYSANIAAAARQVIARPSDSRRIDIEIFFQAESVRPDVDNIIKPILDALCGIVYQDDRQVRSVRAVALPKEEPFLLVGWVSQDVLDKLFDDKKSWILIDVYEGLGLIGPGLASERELAGTHKPKGSEELENGSVDETRKSDLVADEWPVDSSPHGAQVQFER